MDGRKPTGILYVNTHVADPTMEIEYDRWYHDVHFPDVTEPGIFVEATMFHNASVPPAENEGKFLAFYETYWKDVEAATTAFKEHVDVLMDEDRIHAGTVAKSFGIYGDGPIVDADQIAESLKKAINVVKQGKTALIDTITQPR